MIVCLTSRTTTHLYFYGQRKVIGLFVCGGLISAESSLEKRWCAASVLALARFAAMRPPSSV